MSITVEIRGEYIQLDQLLKTTGLCHSGGYAHAEIEAGNVLVDGAVETRKRAKLRPGQHGAGHARRDDGQGGITRSSGQGKAAGHLAHQHRQGVGQQGLLALQGQGFGLGSGHFGLHASHVQLGHITGLLAALRQPQGVLVRGQAFIDELQFGLRGAQLQVGLRHIGLHH